MQSKSYSKSPDVLRVLQENKCMYTKGICMPKYVLETVFKIPEESVIAAFESGKIVKIYETPTDKIPGYLGTLERLGCIMQIKEPAKVLGFTLVDVDAPPEVLYGLIRQLNGTEANQAGKPRSIKKWMSNLLTQNDEILCDSPRKRVEDAKNVIKCAQADLTDYRAKISELNQEVAKKIKTLDEVRPTTGKYYSRIFESRNCEEMLEKKGIKKDKYPTILDIDSKHLAKKWHVWEEA